MFGQLLRPSVFGTIRCKVTVSKTFGIGGIEPPKPILRLNFNALEACAGSAGSRCDPDFAGFYLLHLLDTPNLRERRGSSRVKDRDASVSATFLRQLRVTAFSPSCRRQPAGHLASSSRDLRFCKVREVHLLPERKWQADNRQFLPISHNRSGGREREVERHPLLGIDPLQGRGVLWHVASEHDTGRRLAGGGSPEIQTLGEDAHSGRHILSHTHRRLNLFRDSCGGPVLRGRGRIVARS